MNLANNLRDIPTDSVTGKITLAVRLGDANTRRLWVGLVALAVVVTIGISVGHWWGLLALLAVPLFVIAARPVTRGAEGKALIPVLGMLGRGMLLWSILEFVAALLV